MLVFLFVDDWRRILQASISCSVTVFMHLKKVTDCSNPVVYSSAEAVSRPSLLAVCLHVTYFLPDPRLPPSCPLASNKLYCLLTEADILEQLAEGCYMMMEWLGVAAVTSIMMASPMPFYTSTRRPYVTALWKRDWTGPIKSFYFLFIPCGRLSWLPVSFLLDVKYTLSYRIQPMAHGWLKSTVSDFITIYVHFFTYWLVLPQ